MSDEKKQTPEGQEDENVMHYNRDDKGNLIIDGVNVGRDDLGGAEYIPREPLPEDVQERLEEAEIDKAAVQKFGKYAPIIESKEFREWVHEQSEYGNLQDPNKPPDPTETDFVEYHTRRQDPAFDRIQGIMREYAGTLPEHEQEALDSNPAVFNPLYDKFKEKLGAVPSSPSSGSNFNELPDSMKAKVLESKIDYRKPTPTPETESESRRGGNDAAPFPEKRSGAGKSLT